MKLKQSFPPVASADAKIIILGSMPGETSLLKQQYYGHPRNLFWTMMKHIINLPLEKDYTTRLHHLLKHKIALWDVLKFCEREGSLDSAINVETEMANDLWGFLENHQKIESICFNGQKSFQIFKKHILKQNPQICNDYQLWKLPSTSPANASMKMNEKLAQWTAAFNSL